MKIQELRSKLADASKEDVECIAAEIYKLLPKAKKESDADPLIESLLSHDEIKQMKSKDKEVDFDSLKAEVEEFLNNVDQGYYYEPNRIVPKSKRSKWRFEVKNYVKRLDAVPMNETYSAEAARLMRDLYLRLCRGCGYYIFSSEDPFRAIGITQTDFYERVVRRSFALGVDDDTIKKALMDATSVFLDRETLHAFLEFVLVSILPTSDSRYKTIGVAMSMIEEMEKELKKENKYSNHRYYLQSNIRNLCDTILGIGIWLGEPDDAIKYYWMHDEEKDKEVTLYRLLQTIDFFEGGSELWRKTYENAVKVRKVKPRSSLYERYAKLDES